MSTNDVNFGIGYATGMFYHAPADTALPSYPTETLGTGWTEVGYIAADGITFSPSIASEQLKDWSKTIRRMTPSEDSPTVQAPIISTTGESLKTLFGAVTSGAASSAHGATTAVSITANTMTDAEAFLFIGKDGDDTFMLGTTKGYISTVDDITFAPGEAITWGATITADEWTFMKDNGQVT
ncbi:MAG: hypothetical protein IJK56_11040 [Firmicutes bacterium]|nr:hypothetical protein [Bacillota bacterium]